MAFVSVTTYSQGARWVAAVAAHKTGLGMLL
jgi:hypothetical protein